MQQDDQNTFKNPVPVMITQIPARSTCTNSQPKPNSIQKRNLLHYGFNYILPSFWYQELLDLNHTLTSLQNIQLPSFDTYICFLRLCGLQNPTQSLFRTSKHFSKESALYGSDFLEQSFYLSSKNLSFSKINSLFDQNENQWTVINPLLWSFIESKHEKSQQNSNHEKSSIQDPLKRKNKSIKPGFHRIPKIAVFFTKQFIHQNGRCIGKEQISTSNEEYAYFLFKNVKYAVPRVSLNLEIRKQLAKMTAKSLQFTLIVDCEAHKGKFFRKAHVKGFFCENLPFTECLKGLIKIESFKRTRNTEKLYIYDDFGENITRKIALVSNLAQLSENTNLIISTSQLDEILNLQVTQKTNLAQLLDRDFNYPEYHQKEASDSLKATNCIDLISSFFAKLSKENQFIFLLKMVKNDSVQEDQKPVSKTAGFKPFRRQGEDIQILSGTYYRSDDSVKSERNQNNRQTDQVRNLDSVTTNLDTPAFENEAQSEKAYSQSNYENVRLKKHSSYNRTQRKKKLQNYLQKKKKNNYIVKGTGLNMIQADKNENQSGQYKKRIKHPLFHSLCSLQEDPEALNYLLENMRKVAKESIYNSDELISPLFPKTTQKSEKHEFIPPLETKNPDSSYTKRQFRFMKRNKEAEEEKRKERIKEFEKSLQKIAREIQRPYEAQMQVQKFNEEQKGLDKNLLQKLIEDYQLKKDNQQIKTIIDNSEGPYSEVEKHSFKIKYRGTEKALKKISLENDQVKSMSDGLNPIEDNDETI